MWFRGAASLGEPASDLGVTGAGKSLVVALFNSSKDCTSMSSRIGIAASSGFPSLDAGWPHLRAALESAGMEAVVLTWDRSGTSSAYLDLVLVNYCWGYVTQRDAFLGWAARTAAQSLLVNPLAALRWNSDKSYLRDLGDAGVATIPTTFVKPGEPWRAPADDYVVKPSVGSGGWWAARYTRDDLEAARRHVSALHASGQTVMLQPYQQAVDADGETAMVFFGGRFSHAVRKAAVLDRGAGLTDELWEREVITPTRPPAAHLRLAEAAMVAVSRHVGPTCYARVDVVSGNDGLPLVLEVELFEPSLFLDSEDGAGTRFVEVLTGLLGSY